MSEIVNFAVNFGDFLIHRNLKHLIAHVTNHCNFRCDHCFIDFSKKYDLKLEDFKRLGQQIGPLFWLDIAGGEPFIRKDLAEIVANFDARIVQIPSNGSLPDQMINQLKRMKRMTDAEISVSLSLDGLKKTHDRIRNQKGSWDQVWSTFERLKKLDNIPIKINTVLTESNKDEIISLMKEVRKQGPDFHSIILLRGSPSDPKIKLPELQELKKLGPKIFSILETYDYSQGKLGAHILRNYHKYMWKVSLSTLERQTQVVPCLAGQAHLVVMGNGKVSSCEMLESVGDIKSQSIDEIINSAPFKRQVQSIKDKKCYCTHNCAMLDSILFNPKSILNLVHQRVC